MNRMKYEWNNLDLQIEGQSENDWRVNTTRYEELWNVGEFPIFKFFVWKFGRPWSSSPKAAIDIWRTAASTGSSHAFRLERTLPGGSRAPVSHCWTRWIIRSLVSWQSWRLAAPWHVKHIENREL